jgi:hypothetical protein
LKINQIIQADETGDFFKECNYCGDNIEHSNYMVEKVCQRTPGSSFINTLYEFAICEKCGHNLSNEISKESKQYIESKMSDSFMPQAYGISKDSNPDLNLICKSSNKGFLDMDEFRLSCLVQRNIDSYGTNLVIPNIIDASEIEKLQEQLSSETKDFFGGIKDDLIKPAPDFEELFPRNPVFIV